MTNTEHNVKKQENAIKNYVAALPFKWKKASVKQ